MSQQELIDIYNDGGVKIGSASRDAAHRHGLWHKTFHCWIIFKKGNENIVLFQLRASKKENQPNKLDISAAGHYLSGETIEDGVRELQEEIGIKIKISDLIPLGVRMTTFYNSDQGTTNHEFQDVFFLQLDKHLTEYSLSEEVDGLVAISTKDGMRLWTGEVESIKAEALIKNKNDQSGISIIDVRKSDIVPVLDNYFYRVFIMAELALNDWKHLTI
jgi:isopentenyldiphosphate isomerase